MFTDTVWRFLILETFMMRALCTCPYDHPQKQFCTSEFVLKVRFHKEIHLPVGKGYRVEIKTVFKGNIRKLNIIDSRYLILETPRPIGLPGDKYAIFGHKKNGNIYTDYCKGNMPWESTSKFYKLGLAKYFKTGCDCIGNIHELNHIGTRFVHVRISTNVRFSDRYIYFIFGRNKNGNIYSDMCKISNSWVIPTTFFKRGLAKYYKTGCDCIDEIPRYTGAKYWHWNYSFLRRHGENFSWVSTRYFRKCQMGLPIGAASK